MWVVDPGALDHVACTGLMFRDFQIIRKGVKKFYVKNGQIVVVLGTGTCNMDFGGGQVLAIPVVFYAQNIVYNLLDIRSLAFNNYKCVSKAPKFMYLMNMQV